MTREKAIEWIKYHIDITPYEDTDELKIALDMAIKALEQKPILDKIRAELHATAEMHEDGDYYLRDEWIDEIFNKYKAESEE